MNDCTHDDLGEHPAGLVCLACGQVMDRVAGETVAAARESARRDRVAARIAEARAHLRDGSPASARQDSPGAPAAPSPRAPEPPNAPVATETPSKNLLQIEEGAAP